MQESQGVGHATAGVESLTHCLSGCENAASACAVLSYSHPFPRVEDKRKNRTRECGNVGLRPLEAPEPILDDEGRFRGYDFTSQELLELSAVAVPANPPRSRKRSGAGVLFPALAGADARSA